jgi:nitrogen fixation NifU-like protein
MDAFDKYYSPLVLKHVARPQNMGKIANADGQAMVGNPVCGDIMKIYIKVGRKNGQEYLKDIKFQTLGCGAAIATSSILTTLVKGKKLSEAVKTGKSAILKALGGLPPTKIHCSLLAQEALKKAIINYRKKKNSRLG